MRTWTFSGNTLQLENNDLLQVDAEAIVNAANSRLAGGGGVDGAIQRAAGPRLLRAGLEHVRENGPLQAGEAVLTPGFDLPFGHVIHAVGPIWRGGHENEAELLRSAYLACLRIADQNGIRSLAFPALSCGAYGYPVELAAPVALCALRSGLGQGLVREARMVLRGEKALAVWLRAAESTF
ncbi:macro domain-containing protein [Paucidesulfovibrio longus]|uniref:macro domain-containing protein n=1 Tax=Paucidesulfovibrio longus TaxID=889 RepID=UPI00047F8BD2|nr:macro domain-containing protein [Paucidesulfovibrio longus]